MKNTRDRGIKLPSPSVKFAEFMGALTGDGHITDNNYVYRIEFTLERPDERPYANYLRRMFYELFNSEAKMVERSGENAVRVMAHSKKIFHFLRENFPNGYKDEINIPPWIDSKERKAAYLRGIADTDGSLFFAKRGTYEKHCYPVIEIKMNESNFLDQLESILDDLDIGYYRSSEIKIQLNGRSKLNRWMEEIGFSNPSKHSRFAVWKVQNSCPPNTDLKDRLEILQRSELPG